MKPNKRRNPLESYSTYLGAVFQMAIVILAFVYGGIKLDETLALDFPAFTLSLSLTGVALGLYLFIKKSANDK